MSDINFIKYHYDKDLDPLFHKFLLWSSYILPYTLKKPLIKDNIVQKIDALNKVREKFKTNYMDNKEGIRLLLEKINKSLMNLISDEEFKDILNKQLKKLSKISNVEYKPIDDINELYQTNKILYDKMEDEDKEKFLYDHLNKAILKSFNLYKEVKNKRINNIIDERIKQKVNPSALKSVKAIKEKKEKQNKEADTLKELIKSQNPKNIMLNDLKETINNYSKLNIDKYFNDVLNYYQKTNQKDKYDDIVKNKNKWNDIISDIKLLGDNITLDKLQNYTSDVQSIFNNIKNEYETKKNDINDLIKKDSDDLVESEKIKRESEEALKLEKAKEQAIREEKIRKETEEKIRKEYEEKAKQEQEKAKKEKAKKEREEFEDIVQNHIKFGVGEAQELYGKRPEELYDDILKGKKIKMSKDNYKKLLIIKDDPVFTQYFTTTDKKTGETRFKYAGDIRPTNKKDNDGIDILNMHHPGLDLKFKDMKEILNKSVRKPFRILFTPSPSPPSTPTSTTSSTSSEASQLPTPTKTEEVKIDILEPNIDNQSQISTSSRSSSVPPEREKEKDLNTVSVETKDDNSISSQGILGTIFGGIKSLLGLSSSVLNDKVAEELLKYKDEKNGNKIIDCIILWELMHHHKDIPKSKYTDIIKEFDKKHRPKLFYVRNKFKKYNNSDKFLSGFPFGLLAGLIPGIAQGVGSIISAIKGNGCSAYKGKRNAVKGGKCLSLDALNKIKSEIKN